MAKKKNKSNDKMFTMSLYLNKNQKKLAWSILKSSTYAANSYINHTKYRHSFDLMRLNYNDFRIMYNQYKHMDIDAINKMDDDNWYKGFALGIKETTCRGDSKAVLDACSRVSLSYNAVYSYNKHLKPGDKEARVHYRSYNKAKRLSYYFAKDNPKDILFIDKNHIKIPVLGIVKVPHINEYIDIIPNISSGYVIIDHDRWYISFRYSDKKTYHIDCNDYGLGIDYGIKKLVAISKVDLNQSNAEFYRIIDNYIYDDKYKKMIKRLDGLFAAIKHKADTNYGKLLLTYLDSHYGNEPTESEKEELISQAYDSNKIYELRYKCDKLGRDIHNYRIDKIHKVVHSIINDDRPSFIKIEDLDVSNMISNSSKNNGRVLHRVHKVISDTSPYTFRVHIINKCHDYHIPILLVNRYYPSTQLCFKCGYRLKDDKKLKTRKIFRCPNCGYHEDRDINASLNIAISSDYIIVKNK